MKRNRRTRRLWSARKVIALVSLGLALAVMAVAAGVTQLSGAIFTTTASGLTVNGNIYTDKCDVYLNGGPGPNAPSWAAGLPDGQYYYQVTDPSGSVLLAGPGSVNDTAAKVVTVIGGVVTPLVQLCPFDDTPNPGGEYKVWVTPISQFQPGQGFFGFIPDNSKTDNFKVRADGGGSGDTPLLSVRKFYDANANGMMDSGEQLLPGWMVDVTDPFNFSTTYFTPASIFVNTPGQYTVSETLPQGGWLQTSLQVDGAYQNAGLPSGVAKDATFQLVAEDHDVLFGNLCLGAGGGHTLGFWSNKNGQSQMTGMGMAATLAYLSSLNLKNASGNDFDPTSYNGFRSWLLNATAANMAYMLSAQMAAMALNVQSGSVSGSAQVWTGSGFMSVADLLGAANAALAANAFTPSSDPNRADQEFLKNALDQANNNLNFVQPQACPVTY